MPRGLGSPSGPKAGPALLLTPFFLTPSDGGGGIDEGTGVPVAAGVLAFDSEGLSPFELDGTGGGFEIVDDDSLDGLSSLTSAAGSSLCRALGGSLKVKIKLPFEDFRRTEAIAALLDEAIAELLVELSCGDGDCWKKKVCQDRSSGRRLMQSLKGAFLHNQSRLIVGFLQRLRSARGLKGWGTIDLGVRRCGGCGLVMMEGCEHVGS